MWRVHERGSPRKPAGRRAAAGAAPRTRDAVQDLRVGDDDAKVHIHGRHEPALQLELPKLDSLRQRAGQLGREGPGCCRWHPLVSSNTGLAAHLNLVQLEDERLIVGLRHGPGLRARQEWVAANLPTLPTHCRQLSPAPPAAIARCQRLKHCIRSPSAVAGAGTAACAGETNPTHCGRHCRHPGGGSPHLQPGQTGRCGPRFDACCRAGVAQGRLDRRWWAGGDYFVRFWRGTLHSLMQSQAGCHWQCLDAGGAA